MLKYGETDNLLYSLRRYKEALEANEKTLKIDTRDMGHEIEITGRRIL